MGVYCACVRTSLRLLITRPAALKHAYLASHAAPLGLNGFAHVHYSARVNAIALVLEPLAV